MQNLTRVVVVFVLVVSIAIPRYGFASDPVVTGINNSDIPTGSVPLPGSPRVNWLRALMDDSDPLTAYLLLIPLTIERLFALSNLFKSVPSAIESFNTLREYRTNRAEYKRLIGAIKELEAKRPGLFHDMERASTRYFEVTNQLDAKLDALLKKEFVLNNRELHDALTTAKREWLQNGNSEPLESTLKSFAREFTRGEGRQFKDGYTDWRKAEYAAAKDLVSTANRVTNSLDEPLKVHERQTHLYIDDAKSHRPGQFQFFGANGPIRMNHQGTRDLVKQRCEAVLAALTGRKSEAGNKAAWYGLAGQGWNVFSPFFTVGTAGGLLYLNVRAYQRTVAKYGKNPEKAKQDLTHKQAVNSAVNIKAESSLESQIAARKEELKPFLALLAKELEMSEDEIFMQIRNKMLEDPRIKMDFATKRKILEDPAALEFQILQALPYAVQVRLGKDMNLDQLLKFLSLPSSDEKVRVSQQRLLNTVYSRVLDNIFPELEGRVEFGEDVREVGASHFIGPEIRNRMVKSSLDHMKGIELKVPRVVPPHPAIPEILPHAPEVAPKSEAPMPTDPSIRR